MTEPTHQDLLEIAIKAANVGAQILVEYRAKNLEFSTKGDINNFVTEADFASEKAVRDAIRQARPNDTISGEEFAEDIKADAKFRWSIDPLDGTINYMRRIPFYSTSVGVQNIETGEWVAGAVVAPALNTTWIATKGGGSFVVTGNTKTKLVGPPDRSSKIVATGFAYGPDVREQQFKDLPQVMEQFQDLRRMGSASIDICYVAEGILDAYYEVDIKEHDWAAAALIAEEAGVSVKRPEFIGDLCAVGV